MSASVVGLKQNSETRLMLEIVARAIAAHSGSNDWKFFIPAARAAATAMREPTAAMLEAALPGVPDWGPLPEDWQAMIDYVIAGEPF